MIVIRSIPSPALFATVAIIGWETDCCVKGARMRIIMSSPPLSTSNCDRRMHPKASKSSNTQHAAQSIAPSSHSPTSHHSFIHLLAAMHNTQRGMQTMYRTGLALALLSLSSFILYSLYFNFQPSTSSLPCQVHSFTPEKSEISIRGAMYLSASDLLERASPANLDDQVGTWNATVPKIIHQSWKEEQLPVKFLTWSNSWRIRHPDWQWVSFI